MSLWLALILPLFFFPISYWNWYGFSPRFVMGSLVDIVVGWYLASLVLGWLMNKTRVEA